MFRHAIQIAETVTVGVAEAAWVNLIDECVFPPCVVIGRHCATYSRDGRFSFTKFRCVRCSRIIALVRILRRLGFYFSHELTIAIRVASQFAIALALLIGCPLAIIVTWRITKLFHMIRRLRLRTISPHSLREKLRTGGTIALIDLLNFEESEPAVEGIPGAVRIAPARLRIRDKVFMPKDVEVVLYCSSPREFTSARVALALLRRGIANVFVLDGGLNAWKAEGYPVTMALSSSTETQA